MVDRDVKLELGQLGIKEAYVISPSGYLSIRSAWSWLDRDVGPYRYGRSIPARAIGYTR